MSNSTYVFRTGRRMIVAGLASCALLITACGSAGKQAAAPTHDAPASIRAAPTPAPTPAPCSGGNQAFWLPGPDGSKLEANSIGSGPDAVVFLHQIGRRGMCGFDTYAHWLSTKYHVRAVLVNRCNYGATTCRVAPPEDEGIVAQTKPAIDWARAHGAKRVTLVGASGGGGDALQAAGVIPGIAAVVDLSGVVNDSGADNATNARRLRVPILFAAAPNDRSCSIDKIRALYRLVSSQPKRLIIVGDQPGTHGWDLVADTDGKPSALGRRVASWIRGQLA
jgi:pimeloyl-ACP methyl ester carboxylesterase